MHMCVLCARVFVCRADGLMPGVLWDLGSPLPKSLETSGHRGGHQHTGADALKTGENREVKIQEI